jgi:hypothetical protein
MRTTSALAMGFLAGGWDQAALEASAVKMVSEIRILER